MFDHCVTAAQMNDTSEAGAQKVALEEALRAERRVRTFKGLPYHRILHLPGLGSRPTSRSCRQRLAACWHMSVGADQTASSPWPPCICCALQDRVSSHARSPCHGGPGCMCSIGRWRCLTHPSLAGARGEEGDVEAEVVQGQPRRPRLRRRAPGGQVPAVGLHGRGASATQTPCAARRCGLPSIRLQFVPLHVHACSQQRCWISHL